MRSIATVSITGSDAFSCLSLLSSVSYLLVSLPRLRNSGRSPEWRFRWYALVVDGCCEVDIHGGDVDIELGSPSPGHLVGRGEAWRDRCRPSPLC